MSCKPRPFDADALLDIAERARAGQSVSDITAAYATTAVKLYQIMDAAGIPRPAIIDAGRVEIMRAMRSQYASLEEIADVVGRSPATVQQYLKREGIRLPKTALDTTGAKVPRQNTRKRTPLPRRRCLCCFRMFPSLHVGHRRCGDCARILHTLDQPYGL